jgi:hypothetical protein
VKIRDRGAAIDGDRIRFSSAILPKWARRTKSLDALLPVPTQNSKSQRNSGVLPAFRVLSRDTAERARYLLSLFAATPAAQDPRRQTLIANVLDDFQRLSQIDGVDFTK